jgi:hypothetical protein
LTLFIWPSQSITLRYRGVCRHATDNDCRLHLLGAALWYSGPSAPRFVKTLNTHQLFGAMLFYEVRASNIERWWWLRLPKSVERLVMSIQRGHAVSNRTWRFGSGHEMWAISSMGHWCASVIRSRLCDGSCKSSRSPHGGAASLEWFKESQAVGRQVAAGCCIDRFDRGLCRNGDTLWRAKKARE